MLDSYIELGDVYSDAKNNADAIANYKKGVDLILQETVQKMVEFPKGKLVKLLNKIIEIGNKNTKKTLDLKYSEVIKSVVSFENLQELTPEALDFLGTQV